MEETGQAKRLYVWDEFPQLWRHKVDLSAFNLLDPKPSETARSVRGCLWVCVDLSENKYMRT